MATIKMILFVIGGLILAILIGTSFWSVTQDEAQNLVFASAFSISENIADSIDFLGNSRYDGVVVYEAPSVTCIVDLNGRFVATESYIDREGFRDKRTFYSLMTGYDVAEGTFVCEPGLFVIEKRNGNITVSERNE